MSTMDLGQLFTQINQLIQVDAPDWTATGFYVVDSSHKDCQSGGTEVHFHVAYNVPKQHLCCPVCGKPATHYDTVKRQHRHLLMGEYPSYIFSSLPRVKCSEHGVVQVDTPWAMPKISVTKRLENLVIDDLLSPSSIAATATRFRLSKKVVTGIRDRARDRGLKIKEQLDEKSDITHLAIDEVALTNGGFHTVISNHYGEVIGMLDGRKKDLVEAFYDQFTEEELEAIQSVSMDMWPAFESATLDKVPGAEQKICFDHFHVMQHLNQGVNEVRKQEHRELIAIKDRTLVGTRKALHKHRKTMTDDEKSLMRALKKASLKTAKAWGQKELAAKLWRYIYRSPVYRGWRKWIYDVKRSKLKPMIRVAKMIEKRLYGVVNAIVLKVSNAGAESINSKIKEVKRLSRGFASKKDAEAAIYFHLGDLVLKHQDC